MTRTSRLRESRIFRSTRRAYGALLAAAFVTCTMTAHAATARQVVTKASANYDRVADYIVDAKLVVKAENMHIPETSIVIYYKKPDKVHVECKEGFAMLPRQGMLMGNPLRDLADHANLSVERSEGCMGMDCYVIKANADKDGRRMQTLIWIDKKDYLARQIVARPSEGPGPSVTLKVTYTKIKGKYWMPETTQARLVMGPRVAAGKRDGMMGGQTATATIRFANYRINTGLDDKIFRKREGSN